MKKKLQIACFSVALTALPTLGNTVEFETRGQFELQSRVFVEDPLFAEQQDSYLSVGALPEFFWGWNDNNDTLDLVLSARADQYDDARTHSDIRELGWIHVGDDWESRIGIRRVFWGVTEFQHLVDIINQSDAVEDIDNEDKLGQPMVNLSLVKDWGIVDIFALPYFRERAFSDPDGRPSLPIIDDQQAFYQSSDEEHHLDWAVRWSQSIDEFELALSWFDGTSREPLLIQSPLQNNFVQLVPYYQQISQLGIELQANLGDFLWKLEMIHNQNNIENYWALQGGFEYTLYGAFDSAADLGWLIEYGYDERGDSSNGGNNNQSRFQNDVFIGSRLALNDIASSELLAGLSYDLDYQSSSFLIEASRRYGNNIKLSLDLRLFESDAIGDPGYLFRRDDHIQFSIQYFY